MPPTLPPRPNHLQSAIPIEQQQHEPSLDSDEPPPAYTATATDQNKTVESGPSYPFGPTEPQPHQQFIQPHPNSQGFNHHQPFQSYPNQAYHPHPPQHPYHQTHPNHYPNQPLSSTSTSSNFPPSPSNVNLEPTRIPTHGRPLLHDDRVLVYPPSNVFFCSKCCNTGYKGFDPARPCRKCWEKYGKLWSTVKVLSNTNQLNLQRPLPPIQGIPNNPTSALIVRPGDSRIGGRLCWNCNGKGEIEDEGLFGVLFTSSDRCRVCMGAGRTF
ncbi:uncharacterized protein MELLADRAFT_102015 [Melampsora larici-populina 98AG31]|uniref:Uncharacterized protein n=1 Tax=Melampsora larici-populina (strain 98AG31 / pathotype 3-4-7) TaxID=747676 RepID=F4R5P4_MELLP|nr:uncharacterized protein MELLADRAFT_102015 [Melampsora larici-populina 98AG31]EGG12084.1 hypothetical protein MELLADRAFT_102015 [Melampsora larici-populina 98AG31]